jgi:predicted exporter
MAEVVDPNAPAKLSIKAAERAQLKQFQSYISTVSPFFEQVLTNMLLEQPDDPHKFLINALESMPVAERADIKDRLASSEEARKNNWEDSNFNRAKNCLVVVLTLTLNEDPNCKTTVIETLQELQKAARNNPACIRYDICHNVESNEILINQSVTF